MKSSPPPLSAAAEKALPQRRANRPVTWMHRIEFAAAWGLLAFFRLIGVDASSWLAGKFMRFVGPRLRKLSRRGEDNLRRIYPDWNEIEIRSVMTDVWENLGRVGGEFAHLDRFKPTWDEVEMRDRATKAAVLNDLSDEQARSFDRYKSAGKNARVVLNASEDFLKSLALREPVIFATGHFANWEIMGVVCAYVDIPCAIIYRAANNPLIDEMIINMRGKSTPHWQIPKGPEGARAFIDALKEKYSLGLLVDQRFTNGIKVPFLGHDAMTAPAPARMALNYKLPVIPVTVRRTKGANFVMTAHDAVVIEETGDMLKDMTALTIRINKVLEREIHNDPGQWLWLHRKWGKE